MTRDKAGSTFNPDLVALVARQGPAMPDAVLDATCDFLARLWPHGAGTVRFSGERPLATGPDWFAAALERLTRTLRHRATLALHSPLHDLDDALIDLLALYQVQVSATLTVTADVRLQNTPADSPELQVSGQAEDDPFQKTMDGARRLTGLGVPVFLIATVQPEAIAASAEIIGFFEREGLPFTLRTPLASASQPCTASCQDSLLLHRDILSYLATAPVPCRILDSEALVKGVFHKGPASCLYTECLGSYLAIDAQGDVYPCHRFVGRADCRIGTVEDEPSALAQSPALHTLSQRQRAKEAQCRDCSHFAYCRGGCLFEHLMAPKEKRLAALCQDGRAETTMRSLLDSISNQLGAEQAAALLGDKHAAPYLAIAGEQPHPHDERRNLEQLLAAHRWSKDGAPAKAFAYRQRAQHMFLNVTNNCPLRCTHCSVSATDGNQDMPLVTALGIIADAYNLGFNEISINGGEPFAYRHFAALVAALQAQKQPDMRFTLYTNLYMDFDEALACQLLAAFDRISISIDGDEREHDQRRGLGSYAKTTANIARLLALRQRLHSQCAIWTQAALTKEQTLRGLDQVIKDEMGRLGVDHAMTGRVLPIGRAKTLEAFRLGPRKPPDRKALREPFAPRYSCSLGTNLHVAPNGDIFPCWALAEEGEPIGSAEHGLADVYGYLWRGGSEAYLVANNPKCRDCEVKHLCGGVCHGYRNHDCSAEKEHCLRKVALAEQLLADEYGIIGSPL